MLLFESDNLSDPTSFHKDQGRFGNVIPQLRRDFCSFALFDRKKKEKREI